MKPKSNSGNKLVLGAALLLLAGVLSMVAAPAGQPLSKNDVTLLLLGSSPSAKIIQMVQDRGVDFQMNPDLAKKFHDQGASDDLIDALQKAGAKPVASATTATPPPAPPAVASSNTPAPADPIAPPASEPTLEGKPNAPDAPEPPASSSSEPVLHTRQSSASDNTQVANPPTPPPASSSSSEPTLHTRQSSTSDNTQVASASPPATPSSSEPTLHVPANKEKEPDAPVVLKSSGLKDPDPQQIQHIINEFAAKEKIFREARNNYAYHQINKVQEFGAENEVVGTYEQEWDILYDDSGKRIEKVTYAPVNTLKNLIVTKEDLEGFRSIQPFVLTTDELPEYEVTYLGHVAVDQITAYVFRIRPKEMEKNKQYFQGEVWVDDRDLQIVKTNGKQVPQDKVKHGSENLFPRFTTWREQVDGKFWFPTYTMADDTLYFSNAPSIHMKEVIRYTDYKQFKSGSRILTVEQIDKPTDQSTTPLTPAKK